MVLQGVEKAMALNLLPIIMRNVIFDISSRLHRIIDRLLEWLRLPTGFALLLPFPQPFPSLIPLLDIHP